MSIPAWHCAIRGSESSVAVSGGGHGELASHVRNERRERSQANKKLRAVDPVRGIPNPKRGATIRPLLTDFRVKPIPFLDLEPVHQVADDLIGIHVPTELIQTSFRRQRTRKDLEALAPRLGAEIVGPGTCTGLLDQYVGENHQRRSGSENTVVSLYDLACGRNPLRLEWP
jgi:hypothetical protein